MKRRGRSPTEKSYATNAARYDLQDEDDNDDENDVNEDLIMDTDDQEDLIQSLQEQAQEQVQLFQKAFLVVGVLAIVITLFVYPFLCYEECSLRRLSCGTHAIFSSISHGLMIYSSQYLRLQSPHNDALLVLPVSILKSTPFLLATILNVIPIISWVTGAFHLDVEHFHLGLVVGNVLTLLGSFLLVWDAQSTQQALDELYGAKYEHKSLWQERTAPHNTQIKASLLHPYKYQGNKEKEIIVEWMQLLAVYR